MYALDGWYSPTATNANRSAANMKTFKVTIARILTNYTAKTFTVVANDIVSAQIRVWRKVKKWPHVIAAEQKMHLTWGSRPLLTMNPIPPQSG